jgi:cytoskeletal protein CcmA (bactofilin family)
MIAAVTLAGPGRPPVAAQETGATIVVRGARAENTYLAGGTIDVLGEIAKDLVAVGGMVTLRKLVGGDAIVAGGTVTLDGGVADDVRVAGGTVNIGGEIGGDLLAAGGAVKLAPEAWVTGRTWLAGANVEVAGRLERELKAAGAAVRIAGQIDGDVELAGRSIEILPGARIAGNLIYTSPSEARIDPGARVLGTVKHRRTDRAERAAWLALGALRLAFLVGLIVTGIALIALFPGFTVAAARGIGSEPWRSLGLGVAALVAVPVITVLLMITIVGIPLGLAAIAAWALALLLGYLTAAVFLGDVGARLLGRGPDLTRGARARSLVLALVVLALIRWVPVLGGLVAFVALVFGLGAFTRETWRRYAGGSARASLG